MSAVQHSTQRRWLLIQVHRAQIAHLLRCGRNDRGSQIAERMDAIALLCDRGRTERGQALAQRLVQLERDAAEPIVTELLVGEPVELAGSAPGSVDPH